METVLGIMILVILVVFSITLAIVLIANDRKKLLLDQISSLPSFAISEQLASGIAAIALDFRSQQIGVAIKKGDEVICSAMKYAELTGAELLRSDGGSTKSRSSGFARATTSGSLVSLSLVVTFSDQFIKSVIIVLFQATGNAQTDELRRRSAFKIGNEWYAKLTAITRTSGVTPSEPSDNERQPALSGEIDSLYQLFKAGALSEVEFQQAKTKLLGRVG